MAETTGAARSANRNGTLRLRTPWLAVALAGALAACSAGTPSAAPATSSPRTQPTTQPTQVVAAPATPAAPCLMNFTDAGDEAELAPCTYYVEPEGIPVRVMYTIPPGFTGWASWIGSFKPELGRPTQTVGFSIINVTNLVTNACTDHTARNPVVGPDVDDLATALAELEPFEVKTPPTDVTIYGHSGKHLALIVPSLATKVMGDTLAYPDCVDEQFKSWIGAPLSYGFWGYSGPGMTEEFWVLDVDGRRLVISANYRPDAPAQDVAELRTILDSIEIVPIPA